MALFSGTRNQQPNRLGSIQVSTSEYGVTIPIGWGSFKAPIKLVDYQDFSAKKIAQGGKGGGGSFNYEYYAAVDALIVRGPIAGLGDIYDGGGSATLLGAVEVFTIPSFGGSYTVAHSGTRFYYDEGVTYQAPYSVVANDFGSDGARTLSGTQQAPMARVVGTPAPLSYTVSSSGTYAFAAADAGKTVTITYAYTTADVSVVSNRAPILRYGLAVMLGTTPQTPWSYMATFHPERALAYPGLARIVCQTMDLGSSAATPNLSVEVLNGRLKAFGSGIADCDPKDVITDALTDPVAGCNWPYLGDLTQYSNFCVANSMFVSPFLDSARKVLEFVGELADLTNSAPVWSGSALKIVPYGDTTAMGNGRTYTPQTQPVYEIDEDELVCAAGADAITMEWADLADNFNRVIFEYSNRADNYTGMTIHEIDAASILMNGELPMKTVAAHHFCVKEYAATAMGMMLRRKSVPLRRYTFTLPWYFQLLEPMDIILLNLTTGAQGTTAVRLVSVVEQEDYTLQVTAEDFLYGVAEGVTFPKGVGGAAGPGAHDLPGKTTLLAAFQPSTRVTRGGAELWLALSGGPSWGGCRVWLSLDGASYTEIGTQYGSARGGSLTAPVAAGSDPDTTSTLAVSVVGSLGTATLAEADSLATLCLLGTELLSYETATLTGSTATSNAYNLTYLRRGVFSSVSQAHSAGEIFVRLDDTIFKYPLDPTLAGRTVMLKLTSRNLYGLEEQTLNDVAPITVVLAGTGATTMAVGSYLNGDGSATVKVYLPSNPTGSGTATLANGAVVTTPPYNWPTCTAATFYGVNFNPTTSAYVLYTDRNLWLANQQTMVAIGSTTTPTVGAASLTPTRYSDTGSSPTGTPAGAYTSGQSATVTSSAADGSSAAGICSWDGMAGVLSAAKVLSVTAQVDGYVDSYGGVHDSISVTLDGGATWTVLFNSTLVTLASAIYTLAVPAGTDLANVRVEAKSYSTAPERVGTPTSSNATITVSNIGVA